MRYWLKPETNAPRGGDFPRHQGRRWLALGVGLGTALLLGMGFLSAWLMLRSPNATDARVENTARTRGSDAGPASTPDVLNLGDGVKLELVRIKAGKFLMGSPKDEEDFFESRKPQ